MGLSIEQSVLLELMKSGITGSDCKIEEQNINWEWVVAEAKAQAVLLLTFDSAGQIKNCMPEEVFGEWKAEAYKIMVNNANVQKFQRDMVKIMSEEKHPYIILKGLASAYYYPRAELRALGDVDFLVESEKTEELVQLFLKHGYSEHYGNHFHRVLKKQGAHLEMHFSVSGVPHGKQGEVVKKYLENAVYKGVEVKNAVDSYYIPIPLLHGMILALHMQHHQMGEGIGLRHLCDWACFVNKTVDESFWTELLDFFRTVGLLTYVKIMTKTCHIYMGTKLPDWAEDVNESLCEDVIADILKGGNFGRKDIVRKRSGMMVSNHGKDGTRHSKCYYLYQTLHESSAVKNPKVQSNKLLWLMEDTRRALLYLIRTAKGERVSLIKMIPEADTRRRLYDEFHLFEVDEA